MAKLINIRRTPRLICAIALAALPLTFLAAPAHGQEVLCEDVVSSSESSTFHVTKVSGFLDPIVKEHLLTELTRAENDGAVGFVIWMDSKKSVIDEDSYTELSNRLAETELETGIWVGSSVGNRGRGNANALGGSAQLAASVDKLALAPGAIFGETGELFQPSVFNERFAAEAEFLIDGSYEAEEAIELGLSEGPLEIVADIKQFLASYDSFETVECVTDTGATVRQGITSTRLSGLTMASQLFHTASSPEVAYLFFMLGLSLLVFEFFTAGIGIGGMLGAGFFLLGAYGLDNLPTRPAAVAAILLAMFFIGIDIQTNLPRLYSAVGLVLISIGSIWLYEDIRMSWFTLGVVLASAFIYVYSAMPAMVRARFSTPTIGRKWMIGKTAVALTDLSPEGKVEVDGVPWQAFTNRATPIKEGDDVNIVGIERMLLEAAPIEGAAKDYRDRN